MRAAKAVRDELDPDVVLIARTDARSAVSGGMDEVLRRCEIYLNAGVDMLLITALQNREEIRKVRERFPDASIELNISGINPPLTMEEFRQFKICIMTMPISKVAQIMMYDFLHAYRDRGLEIIGVSVQETSPSDVKAYATKYQLPYTIGFDGSGKIFHAYKAYGLPTQVFIDANGVIRSIVGAPLDAAGATAQIEAILPQH